MKEIADRMIQELRLKGVKGNITSRVTPYSLFLEVNGLVFKIEAVRKYGIDMGDVRLGKVQTGPKQMVEVIIVALEAAAQAVKPLVSRETAGLRLNDYRAGVVEHYECCYCPQFSLDRIGRSEFPVPDKPHSPDCAIEWGRRILGAVPHVE
jgi:hypothetical protein